eukprot:scaffold260_cov328-Prasinococcus_capsulatus_cf.AAC.7
MSRLECCEGRPHGPGRDSLAGGGPKSPCLRCDVFPQLPNPRATAPAGRNGGRDGRDAPKSGWPKLSTALGAAGPGQRRPPITGPKKPGHSLAHPLQAAPPLAAH